jgi:hypothetical protein
LDFLEPQSLANATRTKVHCLKLLIEGYEAELPSGTCTEFVRGVKLILRAVEEYHSEWMEYAKSSWPNDLPFRSFLVGSTSNIALAILRNLERDFLPLLRASLLQSPYLLKQTLERIIAPVASDKKVELTLIPAFDYLYGFSGIRQLAKSQIEKLGSFTKKEERLNDAAGLPDWIVFLTFPIVEHQSALNQIVLAHELAHLAIHLNDLGPKLEPFTLDKDSFEKLVAEVNQSPLRHFATPLSSPEEIRQHCYEVCSEMVKSWMKEIMADLIAVHALGPAYHLAFLEYLAHSSLDDTPDRIHPPPSYRCCRMLEELSFMEYAKLSTAVSDLLWAQQDQIKAAAETAVSRYGGPELVAHATVEAKLDDIRNRVREFCAGFSYKASKYNNEVKPLVDCLVEGRVPMNPYKEGESLKPLHPAAVLNAGSEALAIRWPEFESLFARSLTRPEQLANLNGLLFKSLELNEVVRRFHS